MTLSKNVINDLKVIEANMPVCYYIVDGNRVKVNHKKRLITAYKKGEGKAVQDYANKVVIAFKFALGENRNNYKNKSVPLLNA